VGARRYWAVVTVALSILFGSWAIASPIGSVPDEYMHYKWGYALWTGQVHAGTSEYLVPVLFTSNRITCYAFQPTVTPDCDKTLEGQDLDKLVRVGTTANFYPPAFYALTGWALRIWPNDTGVYVGRLVNAAIVAALLAACLSLLRSAGFRALAFGVLFCVSPMVAFFAGGYNPQALELAFVVAILTSGLVLLHGDPGPAQRRFAACYLALALVGIGLVRPLGWAWIVVLLGLLALTAPSRLLALRRSVPAEGSAPGRSRTWALMVGAGAVVGLAAGYAWDKLAAQAPASAPPGPGGGMTMLKHVVLYLFARAQAFPQEWVGQTGSLDTPAPVPAVALWYAGLGVLVLIGLAAASRWLVVAAVGSVLVMAVVTVLMEYRVQSATGGTLAQGRYVFPLLFALILVTALALDAGGGVLPWRTFPVISGVWVLVQVLDFAQALRRNSYGITGSPWETPLRWTPPVPIQWLLVAATFGAVATVVSIVLAHRPSGTTRSDEATAPELGSAPAVPLTV